MGKSLKSVSLLPLLIFTEVSGLNIRNKLLGTCLQVHDGSPGVRVSLGQCDPHSAFQKWLWLPESKSLRNQYTGECLTAPEEQFEGVHLQPCHFQNEEAGGQLAHVSEMSGDAASQQWSCSKKGHLTLLGKGLHLSATQESTLVFLSREHKQQGSRWRTLDNQTLLCGGRETKHHHQNHQARHPLGKSMEPILLPSAISDMDRKADDIVYRCLLNGSHFKSYPGTQSETRMFQVLYDIEATFRDGVTEEFVVRDVSDVFPQSTKSPEDPTMVFFTMDYGMSWKITMLVLSSLALVLGTVILIFNVYSNRRKKVVCVLKSYTPKPEAGIPGSPVPCERAPLTEHAMRYPLSSPTMQRGEILIEWKDGTVTPLYEA